MQKVNNTSFLRLVKHIVNYQNFVPVISSAYVNEFKLGKSYFYEVVDNIQLLSIQNILNIALAKAVPLNNASIAFRKKYSYLHFFEPHRENYHFTRLDIRSFFHSIKVEDIREVFNVYFPDVEFIDAEQKQSILDGFINLTTYKIPSYSPNKKFRDKQVLPMGFKTSPIISNIIFRNLDIQIQKLCSEKNIVYTRYADDMLFSSTKDSSYIHTNNFMEEMRIILHQKKFQLNEHKTIKAKHTLSLNGYTIQHSYFTDTNEFNIHLKKPRISFLKKEHKIFELRFSNKKTDIIKKMIYMVNQQHEDSSVILKKLFNYKLNPAKFKDPNADINKYYDDQLVNKLTGYRSYLLSMIKFNKKYYCTQDNTINKYLDIVNALDEIIERMITR